MSALERLLAACRSIDSRSSTYLLKADREAIHDALGDEELTRALYKLVNPLPRTDTGIPDPRYPDGVPPMGTPDISVAAPATLNYTAGDAISQDLASYVTGTDASGYVMSLVAVTGTLAGIGASLTTTTISGTAVEGSFTYRLRVTKSGYTFDAATTSLISVAAAVVTDTLAPSIPFGLTISVDSGTPKIDLAGDYPMDQRSATIAPTDPVKVELYKSTDGGAYSLLTTKTASGSQPNPVMASAQIGGVAACTIQQTGADITFSNVTAGSFGASTETLNVYGGQCTLAVGDRVSATLNDYTAGYEYMATGIRIVQSHTPADKQVTIFRRPSSSNITSVLYRATAGQALTWAGDMAVLSNAQIVIERAASNQWKVYQYTTDGVLQLKFTVTVVMSGPVYVEAFASPEGGGTLTTATIGNFCVNSQGRWAYSDTAVSAGHSYDYKARGADSA